MGRSHMGFRSADHVGSFIALSLLALLAGGCFAPASSRPAASAGGPRVQGVNLADTASSIHSGEQIVLSAAKNEWTSFVLQISDLPPAGDKRTLSLRSPTMTLVGGGATIAADRFSAFQVLAMPVDVNRAGYVRHTGLSAANRMLPRALLPLATQNGSTNLSAARDPNKPTDPRSSPTGSDPINVWIDLQIPPEAKAGIYTATFDLLEAGNTTPVSQVAVRLNVYDFVLPDDRHLMMVGQVSWDDLNRLYPDRFEAVTPRLMNRSDARYKKAVGTLDQLVFLAQKNRTQLAISRLQPTVKWLAGKPPQFYWDDYDSVVTPWLKGEVFPDKTPYGFWPLPTTDSLNNYDPRSQREYWAECAAHFDQFDWLERAPVYLEKSTSGRATAAEAIKLSADAAQILGTHPRIRVVVPLEDDQVQLSSESSPGQVPEAAANRLVTANPGVVFASPIRSWPNEVPRPPRWLRTDLGGLIPYVGAGGDERDVRLWAWLASVPLPPPPFGVQYGDVQMIRWPGCLPRTEKPEQFADPADVVWFYPGSWFGVEEPLPTIQLKWLRRAQQDFEYLYLAKQRGERINATLMARLMSKPVELQAQQSPDATFGLMSGTSDPKAWSDALDHLARRILLREPNQPLDGERDRVLNIELIRWAAPLERPAIFGRTARWTLDTQQGVSTLDLRLGIDIFNASDSRPDQNLLQWTGVPTGWMVRPQPSEVAALATYRVQRFGIDAMIDPTKVLNTDPKSAKITFTNGYTGKTSEVNLRLPVARTDRREGGLSIDGSLADWKPEDAVQNGPMVTMFNRPAIQNQQLQPANSPSQIFTGWSEQNFYVAFKLGGLASGEIKVFRNFMDYQFRRAWGEDLGEILIQPVFADGSAGPVMHIVCKPTGIWVERKLDSRTSADPWQAFEGTGTRYGATLEGGDWRGELAIPWKAITDTANAGKGMPVLLRFNFVQHKGLTGESASWAGPVDFGRDDAFTGALLVRDPTSR